MGITAASNAVHELGNTRMSSPAFRGSRFGLRVRLQSVGCRIQRVGCKVLGAGLRVKGIRFRVQGVGFGI